MIRIDHRFRLHVLGTRGSRPVCGPEYLEFGGHTTCFLLKKGDYGLLIDCGSGLYGGAELMAGLTRLDVLFTHLHYDHIMGLLGWGALPRDARIRFYSTFDHWFGEETIDRFICPPFWPVTPKLGEFVTVPRGERIPLEEGVTLLFRAANHPDGANMVRVDTPEGSVCVAFDYEWDGQFPAELARGCDLLLYDGTFTEEECVIHAGWGHSCWQQGCALAREMGVDRLIITHHATERTDSELRAMEGEAVKVFPNTRFARMGDVYELNNKEGCAP